MRRKWILFLLGWLMVTGVIGCDQAVPSDTPAGEAVAANALEAQPSPSGIGSSEEATPSTMGTPAPLWTVSPISPTRVMQEETVTVIPTIPTPSNPALQKLVMQAKEDLAKRLAIEVEQIGLVGFEPVEWRDTSLGCPLPGMMYAQVVTPGYRIVLEVEGESYEYHSDTRGRVVYCESQEAWPVLGEGSTEAIELADVFPIYGIRAWTEGTPVGSGSPEQYEDAVTEAVTADLADRLGVSVDVVGVVTRGYLEVQVASPCGITAEGERSTVGGGLGMGYEVVLEVEETRYRYVTVGGLAHYCEGL